MFVYPDGRTTTDQPRALTNSQDARIHSTRLNAIISMTFCGYVARNFLLPRAKRPFTGWFLCRPIRFRSPARAQALSSSPIQIIMRRLNPLRCTRHEGTSLSLWLRNQILKVAASALEFSVPGRRVVAPAPLLKEAVRSPARVRTRAGQAPREVDDHFAWYGEELLGRIVEPTTPLLDASTCGLCE